MYQSPQIFGFGAKDSQDEQQTQDQYVQQLKDAKPVRENFQSDEEFAEAHSYFMSHQGRIILL